MKIKELIDLLEEEIKENPGFAEAELLAAGEETGNMRDVTGYVKIEAKNPGVYFVTDEADTSEFGEADES